MCEEIKEKLRAIFKDHATSMTTIRYWFNKCKRARSSVLDEECLGHSIKVATEDIVKKINDIVLEDRRVILEILSYKIF